MLVKLPIKYLFLTIPFWFLTSCKPSLKVQKTETQHAVIVEPTIDSATYKMILPYKQSLDAKMNEVIGFAPVALVKSLPESNLGNFFSEAMMQRAKALNNVDTAHLVTLFNSGGLRTSVPQGEVHVGNMYELMPFENELVLFPVKGKDILTVFHGIADKGGAPVAGLRFTIHNKLAENIFIHNEPLDTNRIYTIATSDYLANGGDKFFTIESPKEITKTKILLRDILIDYCKEQFKQNKPISAITDGRISVTK